MIAKGNATLNLSIHQGAATEFSSAAFGFNLTFSWVNISSVGFRRSDFLSTHYLVSHPSSIIFSHIRTRFSVCCVVYSFVLQKHSCSWEIYPTRIRALSFSLLSHLWECILAFLCIITFLFWHDGASNENNISQSYIKIQQTSYKLNGHKTKLPC